MDGWSLSATIWPPFRDLWDVGDQREALAVWEIFGCTIGGRPCARIPRYLVRNFTKVFFGFHELSKFYVKSTGHTSNVTNFTQRCKSLVSDLGDRWVR